MANPEQRVVIVTGGAGVLGRTFCHAFSAEGADIVVADVADPSEVVAEIRESGRAAIGVITDVSDAASVEQMVRKSRDSFGRIDVLVNNAALFKSATIGPFEDISVDEWDRAFAVNVRGPWLCSRAVLPIMREQGYGRIINISSNTVWKGVPGFLHYVTAKSALIGFTRALAREVGRHGITVNTVAPDFVPDSYLAEKFPGHDEAVVAQRAVRRTQTPEDVVGTMLFLAGPGAAFITGQSLLVNGGSHLQ